MADEIISNVYENIAFGLKIKRMDKKAIEKKVEEMLELVNLPKYRRRPVDSLSGGRSEVFGDLSDTLPIYDRIWMEIKAK